MVAKMRGALGEQHCQSGRMVDKGHEHRGTGQAGARRQDAGIQRMIAAQTGGRCQIRAAPSDRLLLGEARQHEITRQALSPVSPSGKNLPLLHTPNWVAWPTLSSLPLSTS